MELYISALLSLLVLLLLIGVFYLYKQVNLLLIKVNKLTYDLNNLQNNDSENDMQNMFGNMDMMNNFMNTLPQDANEEVDEDGEDGEDGDLETDDDDNELETETEDEELSDVESLDEDEVINSEVVDDENVDEVVEVVDKVVEEVKPIIGDLKSPTKNVPSEPAKNFDVGYTTVSDNDGFTYEVNATKNGVKRWKKLK